MNERILEFVETAKNAVEQEGILLDLVLEKFASLIARRCMDIATKEALSIAEIDDGRPTFATSIATAGRIGRQIGLEFGLFDEDVKMTQQPEALRLADALDNCGLIVEDEIRDQSASELRCLYAANIDCMDHLNALKTDYDVLLNALKEIGENSPDPTDRSFARYVLKKVEEL